MLEFVGLALRVFMEKIIYEKFIINPFFLLSYALFNLPYCTFVNHQKIIKNKNIVVFLLILRFPRKPRVGVNCFQ